MRIIRFGRWLEFELGYELVRLSFGLVMAGTALVLMLLWFAAPLPFSVRWAGLVLWLVWVARR